MPLLTELNPEGALQIEPGSFRDRNGRVFYCKGAVFRCLSDEAARNWKALVKSGFFSHHQKLGNIVATEEVESSDITLPAGEWASVLKHAKIPFISYPYEWCFSMLKDAALLQLQLLSEGLEDNFILKDATSFNVQWQGAKPVFIDIPSFELMRDNEPWVGYRQFCQLFLYPLMLQAYKGVAFQPWLRGDIDGISPQDFARLMSPGDWLKPGVLSHVILHSKLQAQHADTSQQIKTGIQSAGFSKDLIKANVSKLKSVTEKLTLQQKQSEWAEYTRQHSYTDADMEAKEAFIHRAAQVRRRRLVWDLGANTGKFSRIAAKNADYVVAMDLDHLAVEHMYQSLQQEKVTNILPMVMNVASSSPNLGWQGKERKSLVDREKPDLTLCLALIHHLVISANIHVSEFVQWLASLDTSLVIEFVTKEDPMVRKLLLNKQDNYTDYEVGFFEQTLAQHFNVVEREVLQSGTRILYYAEQIT